MLTYKCNINNTFCNIDDDILKYSSDILEIISINKVDNYTESNSITIIKDYESYTKTNDFSDLKCPLCKNTNVLHFHKTYKRNFIFYLGNYEVSAIIIISVLECTYCKNDKEKQHYHALLPIDILPYHPHSSNFILSTLQDRIVKNKKIQEIIELRRISHQLFFKWLRGLETYSVSASTILEIKKDLFLITKEIMYDLYSFLFQFFEQYYHPFFLFRLTCIPLIIMP